MVKEEIVKKINPEFKLYLDKFPGGETLILCSKCGACTRGCPSAKLIEGFNPTKFLEDAYLGFEKLTIKNEKIWFCMSCYNCSEGCPKKVDVPTILEAFKNRAVKSLKNIPDGPKAEAVTLIESGLIVKPSPATMKIRSELCLPEPLTPNVVEIRKILRTTGFDRLVGYEIKEG